LPERWDDYYYESKYKFNEGIERLVLYRRKINENNEIKVLDIHDIPWVKRFHRKTV
jgi:hypothetical protein